MPGQLIHLLIKAYDIVTHSYDGWVRRGSKDRKQLEISSDELDEVLKAVTGGLQFVRCIWFCPEDHKFGITCQYGETTIDLSMQVRDAH